MEEKTFARKYSELEALFTFVRAFGLRGHLDEHTMFSMALCTEEIFINALKHNPTGIGDIVIGLDGDDKQIQISMTDPDAPRFDPGTYDYPREHTAVQDREGGGLGIHLVRQLADHLSFDYTNRRSRITLTIFLESHHVGNQ